MDLVGNLHGGGEHLAPAPKPAPDVHDGLPRRAIRFCDPPDAQEKNSERVQAAFIHQCAWHHLVVGEMAGQEPVVGLNVGFRHDTADSVPPSLGIELGHAVDQPHAISRDRQRAGHRQTRENLSERTDQITRTKCPQPFFVKSILPDGYQLTPIFGPDSRQLLFVDGTSDDSLTGIELCLSKKSSRTLAHGQEQPAVHGGVELEAEKPGVALAEEPEYVDVVSDDLPRTRQLGVEGDHGIEKPIDGEPLGL